jgi:hypothetical protein
MSMNGQAAMQSQVTARLQTGWADVRPGVWLAGGLVLVFLLLFFALPVARVFITAFLLSLLHI